MEKKNTVLLTVIAVATLLVAVVGATFAYFTATTTGEGTGTSVNVTTTNTGSVKLTYADGGSAGDLKYPGGKFVRYGTVTPSVDGSGTFNATYKVQATVNAAALASTNTVIKATLYKSDTPIEGDLTSGCVMKTGTEANETTGQTTTTYYYDNNCIVNAGFTADKIVAATETLTITADMTDEQKLITLTSSEQSFTALTKDTNGVQPYYYVVVEYVNNETAEQNADMGKSVAVNIIGVTDAKSTADEQ